jgi:hypothetical protein
MEKKPEPSHVQSDNFWIWRVNREENLMLKEMTATRENTANLKRLQDSILKAKEVASKIKHRPANKGVNTD